MNSPHTHPRATEIIYLVEGEIETGFIAENGACFIHNTLEKGHGTLFPQGSIHYQINTGCKPAIFVAALSDEDPGTSQIAQRCAYDSYSLLSCPPIIPLQFMDFLRTSFRPPSQTLALRRLKTLPLGYVIHPHGC